MKIKPGEGLGVRPILREYGFRRGKNLLQNIRQRREYGKFERCFALSGASSVCDSRLKTESQTESQTEEAPERAKRLSNFPYSRLCLMFWSTD